jgi:signal transduction histidine kinase
MRGDDSRAGQAEGGVIDLDRRAVLEEKVRAANEQVRRAQALRSDFRAVADHELRNPLSSLNGSLSTLATQWERLAEDDRRSLIEVARRAATRLAEVTWTLVDMAEARANLGASPTAVPVRALLADILSDAGLEDVEVTCADELRVSATPGHLAQIVTNLITNALRYGEAPYRVWAEQRADSVVIGVEDSGPGVAPDLVDRMFDCYERGSDAAADSQGLGLAIARALAEANGGRIDYEPIQPHGARFLVTLSPA